MKPRIGSGNRRTKGVLAVLVCVAVLLLMAGVPAAASAHPVSQLSAVPARSNGGVHSSFVTYNGGTSTYTVKPNGVNDTANLQAAFNACTGSGTWCTVQLVKGTYHSDQVYAIGFQGSFFGAGQGRTIVQGLPNMPSPNPTYNTPTAPFYSALPSASNPWPVQFTFVGGSFTVSGMTLIDTNSAPTAGWNDFGTIYTALYAEIQVAGSQANAAITGVGFVNGPGDWVGFNDVTAVDFGGVPATQQIAGVFSVTFSSFYYVDAAVWFYSLLDATATACFNTVNTSPTPFGAVDSSNSQVQFCGNYATNIPESAGVLAFQGYFLTTGLLPSTVYVTDNVFSDVNDGASAIGLVDFEPFEGSVSTLSAVVTGNTIVTNASCGCYVPTNPDYSAIGSEYLASLSVSLNSISGGGSDGVYVAGGPATVSWNAIRGAYIGVWVDYANSVRVEGNLVKNSAAYGIAVTDGSSNNIVAWNLVRNSGLYDLYWDQTGTGDLWYGNVYATSSPAVLP